MPVAFKGRQSQPGLNPSLTWDWRPRNGNANYRRPVKVEFERVGLVRMVPVSRYGISQSETAL